MSGSTPDVAIIQLPIGFTPDALVEAREKKILSGQVFLVVGAGRNGIGGAVARETALQGATVVTSSRGEGGTSDAHGLIDELIAMGTEAMWIPNDIKDENAGKNLIGTTVEHYGKVDSIIIATGLRKDSPLFVLSESSLREVFEVNYFGPVRVMKEALNYWRRQKPPRGRFTVISSLAAAGNPMQVAYASSKAALETTVKSVAEELRLWKERQPDLNISVNAISPGVVRTPFIEGLKPEAIQELLRRTDADRELEPEEVGQLVVFLTSPKAQKLTGLVVPIVGKGQRINNP